MKDIRYIYESPAMEEIETAAMTVVCVSGGATTEPLNETDFNWND